MKLLIFLALSLSAVAQVSTPPVLAAFTHAHLGEGEVVLTGSLTDPYLENHTKKVIHAVTVQFQGPDGQGPVAVMHGRASDLKPRDRKRVLANIQVVSPENSVVKVVIRNVTFADEVGGAEFVGSDHYGSEFNLVWGALEQRKINVYRKE